MNCDENRSLLFQTRSASFHVVCLRAKHQIEVSCKNGFQLQLLLLGSLRTFEHNRFFGCCNLLLKFILVSLPG